MIKQSIGVVWRVGSVIALSLMGVGCSDVRYYWQSAAGHLSVMSEREKIDDLLAKGALTPERFDALSQAKAIRHYASAHLGLPDNDSYTTYVELDRPYVVWSVVATKEFSMRPEESCFPVVGCVTYRGFYAEDAAEEYGGKLRDEGLDVFVGGVQAYSTLGWFDDPLLSSMVDRGDILLAEVEFHELAHQELYFSDDTRFNEAFATLVGEGGVRQWLADVNPGALPKYIDWLEKKNDFIALLRGTSASLSALYARDIPAAEKRSGKGEIIDRLRDDYQRLKQKWGGYSGYDRWFEKPINNARLASVAVYRELVPDFERWLDACDRAFPRFYKTMQRWKALGPAERLTELKKPASCGV